MGEVLGESGRRGPDVDILSLGRIEGALSRLDDHKVIRPFLIEQERSENERLIRDRGRKILAVWKGVLAMFVRRLRS